MKSINLMKRPILQAKQKPAAERSRGQGTGLVAQNSLSSPRPTAPSHLTDRSSETHRQARARVLSRIETAAVRHRALLPVQFVTCRGKGTLLRRAGGGGALAELVGWCYYKSQMLSSPKGSCVFFLRKNTFVNIRNSKTKTNSI